MTEHLLRAVEAIHEAGLDPESWPTALGAVAKLCGGTAATLEVFDKAANRHREFRGFNLPAAVELSYLAGQIEHNPRWTLLMPRQKTGDVGYDYQFIDEPAMDREPFYTDFLARLEMRYFVSGVLSASSNEYAVVSVQRTSRNGHAQRPEIDMMVRLAPHVRLALDTSRRLRAAADTGRSLERGLDWLDEGVALIAADGAVIFANEAFSTLARRDDGLSMNRRRICVADPAAGARLDDALAAALRLCDGDVAAPGIADVRIPRGGGAPPYTLSVRPLFGRDHSTAAKAIVFACDPTHRRGPAIRTLRDIFDLTEAEASLAQALQTGVAATTYARAHGLSMNTVYTHLRRLREKTGCNRMATLIRRLNDLQASDRTVRG